MGDLKDTGVNGTGRRSDSYRGVSNIWPIF
jgi:hypothetical protein